MHHLREQRNDAKSVEITKEQNDAETSAMELRARVLCTSSSVFNEGEARTEPKAKSHGQPETSSTRYL